MASFTKSPSVNGFLLLAIKCDILNDAIVAALCYNRLFSVYLTKQSYPLAFWLICLQILMQPYSYTEISFLLARVCFAYVTLSEQVKVIFPRRKF